MVFKSSWECVSAKDAPSREVIAQIAAMAFPGKPLQSSALASGGCRNINIKINISKVEGPKLLRIYTGGDPIAKKEAQIAEALQKVLPIPQTYYIGAHEAYHFAITDYIEGITLRDHLLRGGDPKILRDAGHLLAKMAEVDVSGVLEEHTAADLEHFMATCMEDERVTQKLSADVRSQIKNAIDARRDLLAMPEKAHLVHGDFGPENILVIRSQDDVQISAVIDWEFAFSGSSIFDVANMLRYRHAAHPALQEYFLAGLQAGGTYLPEDWEMRVDLFNLAALLDCLARTDDLHKNRRLDIETLLAGIVKRLT